MIDTKGLPQGIDCKENPLEIISLKKPSLLKYFEK